MKFHLTVYTVIVSATLSTTSFKLTHTLRKRKWIYIVYNVIFFNFTLVYVLPDIILLYLIYQN